MFLMIVSNFERWLSLDDWPPGILGRMTGPITMKGSFPGFGFWLEVLGYSTHFMPVIIETFMSETSTFIEHNQ